MSETVAATRGSSVSEAFRTAAARHRGRCAVEAREGRLTYDELDRQSNRVAHALVAEHSDRPVAMVAPLTLASVTVMLGALKAGRLFVPLDPRDPPDRTQAAVDELGARLLDGLDELQASREDDPEVPMDVDHPAFVHFTSGSTGRPLGVMRSHGQVCLAAAGFGITSDDRVGQMLPLAFAASGATIFGALHAGAVVRLLDPNTHSVDSLAEGIDDARISVFQTSPSTFYALAAALEARGRRALSVRFAVIGGEPYGRDELERARRVFPSATIANHYGATEASFIAVTHIAPGDSVDARPRLFRRLYPHQTITIVDDAGRAVPPGEVGEIHVSGPNVSLGYLGPPREDGREFVSEGPGRRSIQLSDQARLHADGALELLGRGELVAKVHGQTVHLEAVERALASLPGVEAAVVSPVLGRTGRTRLVAHAVWPRGRWTSRDLRRALSTTLPPFAVPARFVRIDEVPRTARGKIDRTFLEEIAASGASPDAEYVAPRTPGEEALAHLVAEALGVTKIGVGDDIFDLGADSLTIVGLLESIEGRLGVRLSSGDLLAAPTVAELAALSEGAGQRPPRVVVPVHVGGSGPALFCVPGGGDAGMLATRRLGLRLGRPTFSFVSHGFDSPALPDRSVPGAAARYVGALRGVQPDGPYLIAGLSFGGLIAFEMARQLEASGARVALVVLIDPVTRSRWPFAKSLRRLRAERAGLVPSRGPIVTRLARRVARLFSDQYRVATAGIVRRPPLPQARAFLRLHGTMARRYRLAPYAGRTLLLRTSEWQWYDDLDVTRWLTGEVRVQGISGSHLTMLAGTHLPTLAATVREEIAAVLAPRVDDGARG